MAHNMKDHDKALAVRTPMWHHLETDSVTLDEAPTRDEAEKRVHDYTVDREPLYRKMPVIHDDGSITEEFVLHTELELNVRSDTGTVFGAVATGQVCRPWWTAGPATKRKRGSAAKRSKARRE